MKILLVVFVLFAGTASAQSGFQWKPLPDQKKLELFVDGKMLTAYCYFDSTEKPVLFPIKTVSGMTVTRGFPVAPRPGERVDHPHHVGLWLNYESVNGLDFWNNSYAIPGEKKSQYGSIRHQKIISSSANGKKATLKTTSDWVDHRSNVLLNESTSFVFTRTKTSFVIDRTTTLTAQADEVLFKDVKDGMLGLRVARPLELPSQQADQFVDAQGNITPMAKMDNEGVTGNYVSKNGKEGDSVWGTRAPWTYLSGKLGNTPVQITIIDHPKNVGYPTYWHARGYGLYAANPLGQKIFSNGKEEMNFTLRRGHSVTFKYRVIITEGQLLSAVEIDELAAGFSKL